MDCVRRAGTSDRFAALLRPFCLLLFLACGCQHAPVVCSRVPVLLGPRERIAQERAAPAVTKERGVQLCPGKGGREFVRVTKVQAWTTAGLFVYPLPPFIGIVNNNSLELEWDLVEFERSGP